MQIAERSKSADTDLAKMATEENSGARANMVKTVARVREKGLTWTTTCECARANMNVNVHECARANMDDNM